MKHECKRLKKTDINVIIINYLRTEKKKVNEIKK